MLTNEALAERIRRAMEEHRPRIRAAQLASAFGVTPQAVSGWLRTGRIGKSRLQQLAVITGKPLQYFLETPTELKSPVTAYLSTDEQNLLEAYRDARASWRLTLRMLVSLSPEQQEHIAGEIATALQSMPRMNGG